MASNVPRCAAQAAAELRELSGVGPGRAAGRCQGALAHATGLFAQRRLQERARGLRATRGARIPRMVEALCQGRPSSAVSVGGVCAPLANPSNDSIDAEALARCVRAAVERIVDDVAPSSLRPNIILVLTDDQRWDTIGYMPRTLERLHGQGLSFRNAFATTPACSPSRASIYSGQIARHHGVRANGNEPEFDARESIATALSDVGYVNGFFGKYLNRAERLGLAAPPGWKEWQVFLRPSGGSYFGSRLNVNGAVRELDGDEYSTDVMGARVVDFIEDHANEPFFVVYAPYAPHSPSEPAPRHAGVFETLPPHRPPSWREPDLGLKPTWVRFFSRIANAEGAASRDALRLRELETLLAVDESVGKITDALERSGLTDQTVVVFASDHGIHWGEHWTGTKFTAYEESIRMPLVLRYPSRIPLPRAIDPLVANIDLAPTFAAFGGASFPNVDGMSLVPLIEFSSDEAWREEIAIESPGGLITAPSRALRTERWKYIEVGSEQGVNRELYDLESDPYELSNLAFVPGFAQERAELAARLEEALPRGK